MVLVAKEKEKNVIAHFTYSTVVMGFESLF